MSETLKEAIEIKKMLCECGNKAVGIINKNPVCDGCWNRERKKQRLKFKGKDPQYNTYNQKKFVRAIEI